MQSQQIGATAQPGNEWWRTAVIYQIYPRSFADSMGNGTGDLPGVTERIDALAKLGVDALWLSPFQTSPQHDAGYDVANYCDVDPLFGTLQDFDDLLAAAHARDLRIIVDLVPNHTSSEHAWFQAALAASPGSPERARYMFRDGSGPDGDEPPNNWQSVFGGGAWTRVTEVDGSPGQWYLHLFNEYQPDLNWRNEEVREEFRRILRFWLDRGVDGFRVDVAHGLVKKEGLPDFIAPRAAGSMGGQSVEVPYWGQPEVHEIYRDWRRVLDEYPGNRALCAEAWRPTPEETALWVRSDEMHQAFNFPYLATTWNASNLREVIDHSIAAFGAVGAPSTWVLSNHDVIRHGSRLALSEAPAQGAGIGPNSPELPDPALAHERGRAATVMMLALPGSAYLFQGEELGLPEVIDLPDDARQDPTWEQSNHERYGRDGCRVPLPWSSEGASYGFNKTGQSWLPQPPEWSALAREAQAGVEGSTLSLYVALLRERATRGLGAGTIEWLDGYGADVIAYRNGDVTVIGNLGQSPVDLPPGDIIAASSPEITGALPPNAAVWLV